MASAPSVIPLHLSTGSVSFLSYPEAMKFAKACGFAAVELYLEYPHDPLRADAQALREQSRRTRLPIYSIHAPSYERFLAPFLLDPVGRATEALCATARLAREIGAEVVVIHPFPALFRQGGSRRRFQQVLESVDWGKVRPSIENLPRLFRSFLSPIPHCLVRESDFRSFCQKFSYEMTLDTTHALSCGQDPTEFFHACKAHVRNLHFSDFQDGRQHLPLGEGSWDYASFLRALKHEGYKGVLTLEIYPKRAKAKNFVEASIQRIHEALPS